MAQNKKIKNSKNNFDWERAVVLELSREHEYICRTHRVHLDSVVIELFDSEVIWGKFDSISRTIFMSRKLILEQPWHNVIGIFIHEMAHQYVCDNTKNNDRPHGELFNEACRRLGVPAQFSKAGIDLAPSNIDWRTEPRDEVTEKIIDKAKKLLALGTSSNEHEAHLAMERVRELYAKYNLEHAEFLSKNSFVHLVITHRKKRIESWQKRTVSILMKHFFVKALMTQQFDVESGGRVHAVELIGTRENVIMAEYVYYFLLQQIEALLSQALITNDKSSLTYLRGRTSFRLGVLDGFDKKLSLSQKINSTENTILEKNLGLTIVGQALDLFHTDLKIENYISSIYPRLRKGRGSSSKLNNEAFTAGHVAGKSIHLNKPISENNKRQIGILGFRF